MAVKHVHVLVIGVLGFTVAVGSRNFVGAAGPFSLRPLLGQGQVHAQAPSALAVDTVVDDRDPGFSVTNSGSGNWFESAPGDTTHRGHAFYSTAVPLGPGTLWGTWRPNLPADGEYEVSAYIPGIDEATPTTAAYYYVYGINGAQSDRVERVRDQTRAGRWISLGTYRFVRGNSASVRLYDHTSDFRSGQDRKHVLFDAVKWVSAQPTCDEMKISLDPPKPTAGNEFMVEIKGESPDNCLPKYLSQKVEGRDVVILLEETTCTARQCTRVPHDWTLPVTVTAQLSTGQHRIKVRMQCESDRDQFDCPTTHSFSVVEDPDCTPILSGRVTNKLTGKALNGIVISFYAPNLVPAPTPKPPIANPDRTSTGDDLLLRPSTIDQAGSGSTMTDANGEYSFKVVPGLDYIVQTEFSNYYKSYQSDRIQVTFPACEKGLNIDLVPKGEIAIFVHGFEGLTDLPVIFVPDTTVGDHSVCQMSVADGTNIGSEFSPLLQAVADAGYAIYFAEYISGDEKTETIESSAGCLKQHVIKALDDFNSHGHIRQPVEKVALLAHSMGGLVSRQYIESLGGASSVDRLITYGSPHLGIADLFLREVLRFHSHALSCPNVPWVGKVCVRILDCDSEAGRGACQLQASEVKKRFASGNRGSVQYGAFGGDSAWWSTALLAIRNEIYIRLLREDPSDGVVSQDSALAIGAGTKSKVGAAHVGDGPLTGYNEDRTTIDCTLSLLANKSCSSGLLSSAAEPLESDTASLPVTANDWHGVVSLGGTLAPRQNLDSTVIRIDGRHASMAIHRHGGTIRETLRLPDGRLVRADEVATKLPGATYEATAIQNGSIDRFDVPNPPVGEWRLELEESDGLPADFAVFADVESDIAIAISVAQIIGIGRPFPVALTFTDGSQPVSEATVVVLEKNRMVSLVEREPGTYVGTLDAPAESGLLAVNAIARGATDAGVLVERALSTIVEVSDAPDVPTSVPLPTPFPTQAPTSMATPTSPAIPPSLPTPTASGRSPTPTVVSASTSVPPSTPTPAPTSPPPTGLLYVPVSLNGDDQVVNGAQADLEPFQPDGWDGPIVPSGVAGGHTSEALVGDAPTFVDIAVRNAGRGFAVADIVTYLTIDGIDVAAFVTHGGLGPEQWSAAEDWPTTLTAGWHDLKLTVDPLQQVKESNEANNIWEVRFFWSASQRKSSAH